MRPSRSPDILALSVWLLPVIDMLVVFFSAMGSSFVLTELRNTSAIWPWSTPYQVAVLFGVVLTPFFFHRLALYRSHRGESLAIELIQMSGAWLGVMGVLAVMAIATKTTTIYSRVWMGTWLISGWVALWVVRILFRLLITRFRSMGWDLRDVVIIGSGSEAARVVRRLQSTRGVGYRILGYFTHSDVRDPVFSKLRCLGNLEQIRDILNRLPRSPDQAWIALPGDRVDLTRKVIAQLGETTIDSRLVPDTREFFSLSYTINQVAGLPVIDLSSSPMTGLNRTLKAMEDRLLAVLILPLISPLMLLIALGIKLGSPGPVLFQQKRHGWNGEEITVLKFRTMIVHRETEGQVSQATRNDPRITHLGRLLRRTSLDELPQFLNVLAGSMSIVGPRPHAVEHNDLYKKLVSGYALRHKVKPGITGWAQVNGYRGETENLEMMRRRIEYDLYYIEHWSIWLDFTIVILTLLRGVISPKAY